MSKNKSTTTVLHITSKGEKYYSDLQDTGYAALSPEQRTEFNILLDLFLEGDEVELTKLKMTGRNTVLGRLFYKLPELRDAYARVLHRLIKQGYVKARKGGAQE